MLMIVLTIRRERDVNDLRELVEGQRLRLAELRAWLAGLNASQTRRIGSEGEPEPKPIANVKASGSEMPGQETGQSPPHEDDVARATKALEWQREVAARLQSGIREISPAGQATTPTAEDGFKWFRDDPNEPREIVEARGVVNGLGTTYQPRAQAQDSPEGLAKRPAHDELERINRAVTRLKEDMNKGSELPGLSRKPPGRS